jgi:hypothetical protein
MIEGSSLIESQNGMHIGLFANGVSLCRNLQLKEFIVRLQRLSGIGACEKSSDCISWTCKARLGVRT